MLTSTSLCIALRTMSCLLSCFVLHGLQAAPAICTCGIPESIRLKHRKKAVCRLEMHLRGEARHRLSRSPSQDPAGTRTWPSTRPACSAPSYLLIDVMQTFCLAGWAAEVPAGHARALPGRSACLLLRGYLRPQPFRPSFNYPSITRV